MRILYMGTPDFAVEPLKALIENNYDVCGVVTQPDKPVGRKAVLTAPPVKVVAQDAGIRVYQPQTLKNGEGIEILKETNPDVVIVVAYGKILPKDFLDFPQYGCINIHGSLLPKYRGAAPIQRCVLDGEKYAGVTSMQMDVGLDTGDMLLKMQTEIGENETSGELFDRVAVMGAELLVKTLDALEKGELKPEKQNDAESNYAAMLDKTMSPVDWNKPAQIVHNQIRGLDPWPVALTYLDGKTLKLFSSELSKELNGGKAGEAKALKNGLAVFCGDGKAVVIKEVQFEGKKRMNAADFLRGHPLAEGFCF
ncbi:MAG: methionyl-tRNA formyltransferase [Ruminococcaceae bacterium]|nr:methionyl-tRNA formyltransferase [Oscillospiraceae bacterium]